MDLKLFTVSMMLLVAVTNSEEESCIDKLFLDDSGVSCCKSINDSVPDEALSAKINEKCFPKTRLDESEIVKCIYKVSGVLVGDKINATALIAQNLAGKKEADWKKPITDSVNTCMEAMVKKPKPEDYLMDCQAIMMFANCPKNDWTENEKCSTLKKTVLGCL